LRAAVAAALATTGMAAVAVVALEGIEPPLGFRLLKAFL